MLRYPRNSDDWLRQDSRQASPRGPQNLKNPHKGRLKGSLGGPHPRWDRENIWPSTPRISKLDRPCHRSAVREQGTVAVRRRRRVPESSVQATFMHVNNGSEFGLISAERLNWNILLSKILSNLCLSTLVLMMDKMPLNLFFKDQINP